MSNFKIQSHKIEEAVKQVFANRKTSLKFPAAFTPNFFETKETQQRWSNFLSMIGNDHVELGEIIEKIAPYFAFLRKS